jgi:hypothetical protein
MAVMKQGVAGPDKKDEGEQVPLQLLGENKTDPEQVPHDHIDKNHQYQQQTDPGDHAAHCLVGPVDGTAEKL